jgi:hypothetical protein
MTAQVMFPVVFLGLMAFMLSTVIRNGNGTAVIMIILGIVFMMFNDSGGMQKSQWNIFLNPYELPNDVNEAAWAIITFKNRIILSIGSVIFLLAALYNLQKREKFM